MAWALYQGLIIVKRYSGGTSEWLVYHRSLSSGNNLALNRTHGSVANGYWAVVPTATDFTLAGMFSAGEPLNESGSSYVAYLFAHDTTANGLIQCLAVTSNGSGVATFTLPWNVQMALMKPNRSENWYVIDTVRGANYLSPNVSSAEASASGIVSISGATVTITTASSTDVYGLFVRAGADVMGWSRSGLTSSAN